MAPLKITRDDWVKALRSGDFDQAQSTLHDSRGAYCCLGVACAIAGVGPVQDLMVDDLRGPQCPPEYGLVADMLDLSRDEMAHLADLNDDHHSFRQIADLIAAGNTLPPDSDDDLDEDTDGAEVW